MQCFKIGELKYSYLVGACTVGIITPSRKKHLFSIQEVSGRSPDNQRDGNSDNRLHPDEVAMFVVRNKLA